MRTKPFLPAVFLGVASASATCMHVATPEARADVVERPGRLLLLEPDAEARLHHHLPRGDVEHAVVQLGIEAGKVAVDEEPVLRDRVAGDHGGGREMLA